MIIIPFSISVFLPQCTLVHFSVGRTKISAPNYLLRGSVPLPLLGCSRRDISGITENGIGQYLERGKLFASLFSLSRFNCAEVESLRLSSIFYSIFYLRSLPLAVCLYSFGARTKISAPNYLLRGSVPLTSLGCSRRDISGITENGISQYLERGKLFASLFSLRHITGIKVGKLRFPSNDYNSIFYLRFPPSMYLGA